MFWSICIGFYSLKTKIFFKRQRKYFIIQREGEFSGQTNDNYQYRSPEYIEEVTAINDMKREATQLIQEADQLQIKLSTPWFIILQYPQASHKF